MSCCPVFQPDRKNLAVHVSLSSNLHNVKELTPFATFVGGVGGGGASEFRGTEPYLRLPGSRSALSVNVEQWEQLVLGVVNVAGCIRDVSVCQHPIFNFQKVRNLKT